jgi:error-prone DNA polymerase
MAEIEVKLRAGMTRNGITGMVQDSIIQSISSFALYGFPESHAASFALITYASAYLREHYRAAFLAAMLNNQPMGFYNAMTLVKDAQRHGLHFKAVDVLCSTWPCTLEQHGGAWCVRLGFNYVSGFHHETAERLVAERERAAFTSIDDLVRRVPALSKKELNSLADLGALNSLEGDNALHRRDALWHAQLAIRPTGELFEAAAAAELPSPLEAMTPMERLVADFRNTGLTIGAHPMRFYRERLQRQNIVTAEALQHLRDGVGVRVAGAVLCRQQPSTAKGFVFVSLEDETGIVNAIVPPALFEQFRTTIVTEPYLVMAGTLQNQQGAVSVKAVHVSALRPNVANVKSHDFC